MEEIMGQMMYLGLAFLFQAAPTAERVASNAGSPFTSLGLGVILIFSIPIVLILLFILAVVILRWAFRVNRSIAQRDEIILLLTKIVNSSKQD